MYKDVQKNIIGIVESRQNKSIIDIEEDMMVSTEEAAFVIISAAGDAQSTMLEALSSARQGDFAKAMEEMKDAEKKLLKAHRAQTDLIAKEAQGEKSEYSILMVHAQDHLMNAMLSKHLIKEMVHLYQEIKAVKA